MAGQIINDRFLPLQVKSKIKLTSHAAARLKMLTGMDPKGLAGLTNAEISERCAAIDSEINKLAQQLRLFSMGLLLLTLLIALITA